MTILDLSLTYHWYDEIASGRKKEEYREWNEYWTKRLRNPQEYVSEFPAEPIYSWKQYDAVRFHRGQGSRTTMLIECKNIRLGYGNPEWGAPTDREVFILKLGNIL